MTIYTDTILFLVGVICAIAAASFASYLMLSGKRSRTYRELLRQETELFGTISTTSIPTQTGSTHISREVNTGISQEITYPLPQENSSTFGSNRSGDMPLNQTDASYFDDSALEGRYVIRHEIKGGGMSRVFLADSAKLGNQWIVKFIPKKSGILANEENILKLLNHNSLPRIIDIFNDDKGIYIVQSYIEGASLNSVTSSGVKINQTIIHDWATQICQVLGYLHTMQPHPIHHLDLKPSNIIVTHDNRLVLIDFGVSKRYGADFTESVGITYKYAAPEQIKNHVSESHQRLVNERFGQLPPESYYWNPDARTDIYSLGVVLFELATGNIPTINNMQTLKETVSTELQEIILKCLRIDPNQRYQSVGDMLVDLHKIRGSRIKMVRSLFMRKLASVLAVFSVLVSGGSILTGFYVYEQESASILDIHPEMVTISIQQSSDLVIEKRMPNGDILILDNSEIRWEYSHDNIAQIDGNRISGLNVGDTTVTGMYRNKSIILDVRVVERLDGLVDVSQRFEPGRFIELFAGTTDRDFIDGAISEAEFVSPESLSIADDGTIYITDSGRLRVIQDGVVESVSFEPSYISSRLVRCYGNDAYILTDAWQDEYGYSYGIIKLNDYGAQGLYITDAVYSAIEDFAFTSDGLIYYIDRNEGIGATYLKSLNPLNTDEIITLCELPDGTCALTIGENDDVYLANSDTGVISLWRNGELTYFAGIENDRAFIDGVAPLMYMPQYIQYHNGFLYVWDFNVLRRISIVDGVAYECITIAGEVSASYDMEIEQTGYEAESIVLPNSRLMDFLVTGDGILITDPKRGVIWRITL